MRSLRVGRRARKQREKRRLAEAKTFEEFTVKWLAKARMADSTRSMRKSIIDRDIMPTFRNKLLAEISADDLRALCGKVKAREAPATAVHIRDIVKQVFGFAILHGEKATNPADDVGPSFMPLRADQGGWRLNGSMAARYFPTGLGAFAGV